MLCLAAIPTLLAAENPLEHVVDHRLSFLPLTYHMVMLITTGIIMLVLFPMVTRKYRAGEMVPTGTRNFLEAILMYIREEVVRPILGELTDQYIGFLWTLFFFILINNLLGLVPLTSITLLLSGGRFEVGGTATSNIWVTGSLALIAFLFMQFNGIRANGLVNYAKHFLGGAPWYMFIIMIPVEIIGMFVKPFALAIRLFANMTAGHIMIAVLISFVAGAFKAMGAGGGVAIGIPVVIGCTAVMVLETFVAFLQAYIFVFLVTLFVGQLVVHEHEHQGGEGGHHDEAHSDIGGGDLTDLEKLPADARQAGARMAG